MTAVESRLREARDAAKQSRRAEERFHAAIRKAASAGATRRELADAVGLSKTRVQQIVHGTNR